MDIDDQAPNKDTQSYARFKIKFLKYLGRHKERMSKTDMEQALGEETVNKILSQKQDNVWIVGLFYVVFLLVIFCFNLSSLIQNERFFDLAT